MGIDFGPLVALGIFGLYCALAIIAGALGGCIVAIIVGPIAFAWGASIGAVLTILLLTYSMWFRRP